MQRIKARYYASIQNNQNTRYQNHQLSRSKLSKNKKNPIRKQNQDQEKVIWKVFIKNNLLIRPMLLLEANRRFPLRHLMSIKNKISRNNLILKILSLKQLQLPLLVFYQNRKNSRSNCIVLVLWTEQSMKQVLEAKEKLYK